MKRWLSVVGIGEDGLDGLSPAARTMVETAEVLIGGARHLAMVPPGAAERWDWRGGFRETVARMESLRGRRVCVLASGDPLDYGAGSTIARRFAASEIIVVPAPGAFSLACARMGWSRPDVETLTLHGRPLETLNFHIRPGVRLLILSEDGTTPAAAAALLRDRGFGPSPITVLERLGGPSEERREGTAGDWSHGTCADLNTIAFQTEDAVEGLTAFLEKRKPSFKDR